MNFDIVRESIFNPDSGISGIMNDLLKVVHKENKINDYSIDVKEKFQFSRLESDSVMIESIFDQNTVVNIGSGRLADCIIVGVYNNHGKDDSDKNHLSVALNDQTGYYSIRSEKDNVTNELNLCFKYFDPYAIKDLEDITKVANRILTADDYMRIGHVEKLGFIPDIKEIFSMEDGSKKIIEFVKSFLQGEMDRGVFSKIVGDDLERHNYR